MKKYLMGIVAIIMAVGLSAYSTSSRAIVKGNVSFTDYFWYPVNSSGVTTDVALNSIARNKAYALAHLTPCTDVANKPNCIFGDTNGSLSVGSTIVPAADAKILKTN